MLPVVISAGLPSFILPLPRTDFTIFSSAFFSETSPPPHGCTAAEKYRNNTER